MSNTTRSLSRTLCLALSLLGLACATTQGAQTQAPAKEAEPAKETAPAKEAAPAKETAPAKDTAKDTAKSTAKSGDEETETRPISNLTKADMKYSKIYVDDFTIAPKGVAEEEPKPYLAKTHRMLITQLGSSGLFELVKTPVPADLKEEGALIVRGELTALRVVGGGARFWLGIFAGKSDECVKVKLVDAASGKVVAESDVRQNTSAWGSAWTGARLDKEMPSWVGERIAEFVVYTSKK
jgi:hypothetical protein